MFFCLSDSDRVIRMRFVLRLITRSIFRDLKRKSSWHHPRIQVAPVVVQKKTALNDSAIREAVASLPRATVISVIDGDTVIVSKGWQQITIRLDSIDCPEDGQHWGDIAAYGLIKLIGGQNIHLEEHGLDPHGRTLATIYVWHVGKEEWVNVNERMVTLGHAWVMRQFYDHLPRDRQNKLERLENWSRSKKAGLWRTENPVPPWQWRKQAQL
jgi:micrococcal nuclease